ncbi:2-oxoglutarate dehydrogenase complex dihydrolipoyllysine-residue succinyltransferase [Notoacmeibacter sp. MSK16QG-6]|uniref:2-oxoglutarate dehydrogenase complex dihydrolipoyllysine-residue succinyltransferase n=1 Tax=Notoacmeibacter sp. MSK16QG-6 TaxID=2957982 RepID=UPI00209E22EF|nr:2-oxoglutarate dehydrogenase complex dihydrolipoyllysine-residue succinyltransferase [Notoacmeibacter sp. MSK16QG-6]MCP1199191.1 2-oxoglutarate dehydrogenase complex dihydrolipoyllysine-residue succinyltransferase [Notoacmeibacter sp. MSK16QG-6]
MATEIRVPSLGESVSEAQIGEIYKKVGDTVAKDESLLELETDKAAQELPSPVSGTITEIAVETGDEVEIDTLLMTIEEGAASSGGGEKAADKPAADKSQKEPSGSGGAGGSSGGKLVDVNTPSAGESVTEADIGEIFVKVGDTVKADDPLLELETDKAAQEVPAPVGGVIREIAVSEGDTVEPGDLLVKIEEGAQGGSASSDDKAADYGGGKQIRGESGTTASRDERHDGDMDGAGRDPAPAAAKLMRENDLTKSEISGSGKGGQILKGDVLAAIERGKDESSSPAPKKESKPAPARPASQPDDAEREERVKMSRLRQTIAKRLKGAQETAAMLTTFNEVDMSAVMDLRKKYKEVFEKKHGVKLGFMGFFTKAVCHALQEIPAVNAEIDGSDIIYKHFAHIGVAVGTDRGLVVPVVRDADQMSIAEIEKEIGRLGLAARDGELTMADMQGGTFTISNGGVYGSLMSTPILNSPQSGILGMHKIQERPMVVGGQIVVRPMMYLALSYDHRIVDGKEAVTFLVRVKESLEDPERLVLDL